VIASNRHKLLLVKLWRVMLKQSDWRRSHMRSSVALSCQEEAIDGEGRERNILLDMSKRLLALVTGSTDGIGKATALILANEKNFDVIVHGRTKAKAEAAIADLVKQGVSADRLQAVGGDFSSFAEVRQMGAEIVTMAKDQPLDVVVHNAGLFVRNSNAGSEAEGLDITMVVNHFSPLLVQHLITPAQGSLFDAMFAHLNFSFHSIAEKAKNPRVLFVSSALHRSGKLPNKSASVGALKAYRGGGNDS
jgi:NAD(P)-dependent dehydrogenase (short-subunit alcohol dehydrogenase family)